MTALMMAMVVAVVSLSAQTTVDWADEVTTEVFDGAPTELGWIRAMWCDEGSNPLNKHADVRSLAANALSVKIVPEGSQSNAEYADFAVVAKPGSSVVSALNDYKELSFDYDANASPTRVGFADLNNWIGSDAAKARLVNHCGVDNVRSLDIVYQSSCNGGGLHIWGNTCRWQWNNDALGQNIEIYFGYATNPETAEPTPEPTANPTPFAGNPKIELPWSTERVQEWSNIWIVNSDESITGTGTLLDEADLSFLANNNRVVSLEKCLRGSDGNGRTEHFFYNLYNGIKDRNAETTVLFYWNIPTHFADCYTHFEMALIEPEDAYLYDDEGNGPLFDGSEVRNVWDLRKPEVRAWNVQYLENVLLSNPIERTDDNGMVDGLFLDGLYAWLNNFEYVNADGAHVRASFSQQTIVEYNEAVVEFLKEIKAAMPNAFVLGNGMFNYWFNEPSSGYMLNADGHTSHAIPYIDGICLEHYGAFEEVDATTGLVNPDILKKWVQWSTDIVVNDKFGAGKSIFVKAFPGPVNALGNSVTQTEWKETEQTLAAFGANPTDTDEARRCAADNLDFVLAAYLCGVHNERVYLSYSWWYRYDQGALPGSSSHTNYAAPEGWYPQLHSDLGAALGPAVFSGDDGYFCERAFESASVSVDLSDPTSAVIEWATRSPTSAAPTAVFVPTPPPTAQPTIAVPDWADEVTTIEYDGKVRDIAWIHVFWCAEGTSTFVRDAQFAALARTAVTVKIVPAPEDEGAESESNPEYDNFAVVARPDSNVILALNDYKELSYQYDPNQSPNRIGFADVGANWIGSSTALKRLIDGCGPDNLRPLSIIYAAQCNGAGLHLWNGQCKWEWGNTVGQDIEVYFGFDLDAEP